MLRDLLDTLYKEALATGKPLVLAEVASRYLQTGNGEVAARVLSTLVERDPRFRLQGGDLVAIRPLDPFVGRSLGELRFAVLDFETNGLTPHDRAIEVGVVCLDKGEVVDAFTTLLDPGTPVSPFVERLTGICRADLRGKPSFPEVWPALERLLEGRVLIAHNLPFDRRILRKEVALMGGDPLVGAHGLCTVRLSRRLFPREESHCLDAVAERLSVGFGTRHRALGDAEATAEVLLKLLRVVEEREGVATWEALGGWLAPPKRGGLSRRKKNSTP